MNPWGEYKRRSPANAAVIGAACLKVAFILMSAAFAFYALKCKPFQSMSMAPAAMPPISMEPAHPITRHNKADEALLRRSAKIAPVVVLHSQASSLSAPKANAKQAKAKQGANKQIAAGKQSSY